MHPNASIVIVEQPVPKYKRFRYKTEGLPPPLHGVSSIQNEQTYPSIKIVNYTGKVSVVVSCVTATQPYRPHPHELVGKHCDKGVCYIADFSTDSSNPSILSFRDLRIQSTRLHEVAQHLATRTQLNINPFGVDDDINATFRYNINAIRLCFEAIIQPDPNDPEKLVKFPPTVTHPIHNSKDVPVVLRIQDISDTSSPVGGGKKIMIFCNKISKDDIQIRLYEENGNKNVVWVGWGKFQCHEVHRGVGIAFRTPKYYLQTFDQPKNIFIELVRPSDNVRSNRFPFQYVPDITNIESVMARKQRKIDKLNFEYLKLPQQQQQLQWNIPQQASTSFDPDERGDTSSSTTFDSTRLYQSYFPLVHENLTPPFQQQEQPSTSFYTSQLYEEQCNTSSTIQCSAIEQLDQSSISLDVSQLYHQIMELPQHEQLSTSSHLNRQYNPQQSSNVSHQSQLGLGCIPQDYASSTMQQPEQQSTYTDLSQLLHQF